MVINSTNINKMNNQLSSYLNSLNIKKTMTYDLGNSGPGLGQAQKCGSVKLVIGTPTLLS
jgi:hypothetical protein